jgi:putative ABC transport system permease protein
LGNHNGCLKRHISSAAACQGNPNIRLQTYSDAVASRQAEFDAGWGLLFILALLLGVFGVINLINTNAATMLSRRHEIGIMQAIGMTGKQLRTSLMSEGLITTLTATLIAVILGFPAGYMACRLVNASLTAVYGFPWKSALSYFSVLLAGEALLTFYDVRVIQKDPLVERISRST